ncbi:MAG TPA: diacylglycerol kinase family protein [Nevskiaceae bacterium]|nr:diacylglycerol kinase family protein [Nevskiaceae bacterium]
MNLATETDDAAPAAPAPAPALAGVAPESVLQAARSGPLYVVLNAGAGSEDADEREATLARVFGAAGRRHHCFAIGPSERVADVAEHAVRAAQARGGVVVAAGGDGTISAVAHAVLGSGCPFGVLPQGTFNYFAREHGIPQDTQGAAEALLHASVEPVQAGLVNDRTFLVNASLGLYPKLLEDRETWKAQLGRNRAVAMLAALRTLLRERRQLQLTIESRHGARTLRTPTLFVGNNRLQLDRVGLSEADALERGRLAAIVLRPISNVAMFGLALRGALGQLGDADHVSSFDFRRIAVHVRGLSRVKVAMDGEVEWMTTPLTFAVAPEPLWLLMPPPDRRAEVK